jgi:hypothetical protein
MTRRLAQLILLGYPLAFRRRYGDEMRALLEQTPSGALTVLDLLRGALLAHLRPAPGLSELVDPGERLRASTSGVLACWVAFAAAGFGFYKTTEDQPFEAAGSAHTVLGGAHLTIQFLAVVGSLAVLAGAFPLIVAALAQARREPSLRVVVSLPVLAVIVFAGLTRLMELLASSQPAHHNSKAGGVAFVAWGLAGLACAAICVLASRRALFAVPVAAIWSRVALLCGTLLSAVMVAMALATALYAVALPLDSSALAGAPNGPLQLTSVSVSLILQLLVMVLAGVLATTTTRRGWRALSTPNAAAS